MSIWEKHSAPNAGLLFYKQIYKEEPVKQNIKLTENELRIDVPKEEKSTPFDAFYKDLYQKSISKYQQIENPVPSIKERLILRTTYPGLLVGSGYPHDTKAKGDFKIGFFFDHTSGQPVIPGSSVKGVLNSVFELDVTPKGKNFTGEKSVEYIKWLLTEIDEAAIAHTITDSKSLNEIKQDIFGDEDKPGIDVFFDAVINIDKTGAKPFLANDFITPHENPLKNPNPIQFLKVLPGICFEFRFKLSDKSSWNSDLKIKLFNKILSILGIGAKTNVGYGQFVEFNERHSNNNPFPDEIPNSFNIKDLPDNSEGIILKKEGEYVQMVFNQGTKIEIKLSKKIESLFSKKERKTSNLNVNVNDPVVISHVKFDGTNLTCQIRIKKS